MRQRHIIQRFERERQSEGDLAEAMLYINGQATKTEMQQRKSTKLVTMISSKQKKVGEVLI